MIVEDERYDQLWMETAISNLLDNAIKFTPAGGHIEISSEIIDNEVHKWVKDNGRGKTSEELAYIFDRFYRIRGSQEIGSGLGLSIVQSVVRAHRGSVSAENKLDEDSTFTIKLPISL